MFLAAKHPELNLEFVNRGVDGETILDLEQRWDQDIIAERPDWLFIKIGVNDVLYRHLADQLDRAVSEEEYRAAYNRLIERTRKELDCHIVLIEPSPLEEDLTVPSQDAMRATAKVVREIGSEHGLDVIHVFQRFYEAIERAPNKGWMVDVPHPNLKGQAILALAVLDYLRW